MKKFIPSVTSQSQKEHILDDCICKMSITSKFRETRKGVGEERMGRYHLMGTDFCLGDEKFGR